MVVKSSTSHPVVLGNTKRGLDLGPTAKSSDLAARRRKSLSSQVARLSSRFILFSKAHQIKKGRERLALKLQP